MRRKITIAGALVGLMALGAVAGYVLPSSAAGGSRHREIVVFSPNTKDHTFDQGTHGFSEGDYQTGHGPLLRHQKRQGSITHVCHVMDVHRRSAVLQCEAVVNLRGGRLTGLGDIRFSRKRGSSAHIAITGGNGIYRDASGTLNIDFNQRPNKFTFSIDY
jgi:hypothetical protein